jgi:hypothetical protein
MCNINNKLQLCTCTSEVDVYELDNYWVYYKYNKTKSYHILGMPIFPINLDITNHENNLIQLPILLNDGNVFDVAMLHENKDRLQISIQLGEEKSVYNRFDYGFEYRKGKWHYKEYCLFSWANKYDTFKSGNAKFTNE